MGVLAGSLMDSLWEETVFRGSTLAVISSMGLAHGVLYSIFPVAVGYAVLHFWTERTKMRQVGQDLTFSEYLTSPALLRHAAFAVGMTGISSTLFVLVGHHSLFLLPSLIPLYLSARAKRHSRSHISRQRSAAPGKHYCNFTGERSTQKTFKTIEQEVNRWTIYKLMTMENRFLQSRDISEMGDWVQKDDTVDFVLRKLGRLHHPLQQVYEEHYHEVVAG